MNNSIKKVLAKYNQNPSDYLNSLEDSLESASILIQLMKFTNHEPSLRNNIRHHANVSPKHIIAANEDPIDISKLIILMYLTENAGINDIAQYYIYDYQNENNIDNLSLSGHCLVVTSFITKIVSLLDMQKDHDYTWFRQRITGLLRVISDFVKAPDIIDKEKLAPIMRMYHIINHIAAYYNDDCTNVREKLDTIATHLYGDRKEQVINKLCSRNLWSGSSDEPEVADTGCSGRRSAMPSRSQECENPT